MLDAKHKLTLIIRLDRFEKLELRLVYQFFYCKKKRTATRSSRNGKTKGRKIPIHLQSVITKIKNQIQSRHIEKIQEVVEKVCISPAVISKESNPTVKIAVIERVELNYCEKGKVNTEPRILEGWRRYGRR